MNRSLLLVLLVLTLMTAAIPARAQDEFEIYTPNCSAWNIVDPYSWGAAYCTLYGTNYWGDTYRMSPQMIAVNCSSAAYLEADGYGGRTELYGYAYGEATGAQNEWDSWVYPDGSRITFGGDWVGC
jgi:hypothetical protein